MTTESNKILVRVPFTGFYESDHKAMIDDAIDQEFESSPNGGDYNIPEEFYLENHINYKAVFEGYAKRYMEEFADKLGEIADNSTIELEFESLTSPKEYNFETDKIFAYMSHEAAKKLYRISRAEKHKTLIEVIKECHTSRSGFHSFYSNDIDAWISKPVIEWDHNQLETLIRAVLKLRGESFKGNETFMAYNLMDQARGNGVISSLITDNMSEAMLQFSSDRREAGKKLDYKEWCKKNHAEMKQLIKG